MALNTTEGQTIARSLLATFINTGTSASPVWSILGLRVEDSSLEYDYQKNTFKDILGKTWTDLFDPIVTQSFDPAPLDAGDAAIVHIHNLAVIEQDAASLAAQDMLVVHYYAGTSDFAERYTSSAVTIDSLGGEGGGHIDSSIDVTFGGTRTKGTVTGTGTEMVFTAAA